MSGLTIIGSISLVTAAGEQTALKAKPLPGYDSYDRRLGFTISEGLLRLLNDGAAGLSATARAPARPHPILLSS
jgi:hypothetical protein